LAALVLTTAGLGGCSSSGEEPPAAGAGIGVGAPIRLADCTDWRNADVAERLGTVGQIRDFAGGPVGSRGGRGATLPDERAYDLFQGYCENEFARAFKLYKLYTRAAAFQGLAP
jgi:hypothetical protein